MVVTVAAAMVHGQITMNPLPAPIEKRGLAVQIRDVVRLPDTRAVRPADQDPAVQGWARINHVREVEDGRRFVSDQRGFLYVIGPDKKVKLMLTYPASTGRNFDELLRVIDSLQLTANYSVATPVNWKDGEDCIIVPAVTDEQAKEKFPAGWKTIKPYLRVTPQPNKVKGESQSA